MGSGVSEIFLAPRVSEDFEVIQFLYSFGVLQGF